MPLHAWCAWRHSATHHCAALALSVVAVSAATLPAGDSPQLLRRERDTALAFAAEVGADGAAALLSEARTTPAPTVARVECEWEDWKDWGPCSTSCGGDGYRSRTHVRNAEAFDQYNRLIPGHVEVGCDGVTETEMASCNVPCPVDCRHGPWGAWSDCSKECGGDGVRKRHRDIEQPKVGAGMACLGDDSEMDVECADVQCAVDCLWSDWGEWSACTASCGGGASYRTRPKVLVALFGGKECNGTMFDEKPCKPRPCPGDCLWESWGEWGECSATCNDGVRLRTRVFVAGTPANGGKACKGNNTDSTGCFVEECPFESKDVDGVADSEILNSTDFMLTVAQKSWRSNGTEVDTSNKEAIMARIKRERLKKAQAALKAKQKEEDRPLKDAEDTSESVDPTTDAEAETEAEADTKVLRRRRSKSKDTTEADSEPDTRVLRRRRSKSKDTTKERSTKPEYFTRRRST